VIRVFIGLLVFATCGWAQAAPLVYFSLEGRSFGSSDPFASNVAVEVGDTIEYRLRMQMAPAGSVNTHLTNVLGREGNWRSEPNGANSLSISILQDPSDPIQIDLHSPANLTTKSRPDARDGWNQGVVVNGGTPTPRTGTALNDLINIRPMRAPGVFNGQEEAPVFTGLFTVESIDGGSGLVQPEWGYWSGSLLFDHHVVFATAGSLAANRTEPPSELGADPLAHFTPLTLTALQSVPEPSTIALWSAALIGIAILRRRTRRQA
jgi:hypothetical protein